MLSLFEKIKKIWVVEYYFESIESKIEGKLLVNSDTEENAIGKFRDYFSTYEKSFFYYKSILSSESYINQSEKSELLCIKAMDNIDEQDVIIFEEREVSYPLAIESSAIVLNKIEYDFIDDKTFILIDASKYEHLSGDFILTKLHAIGFDWTCLLKGKTQSILENSAPYLIKIKNEMDITQRKFVNLCLKNPICIFIKTNLDLFSLSSHLRKFTYLEVYGKDNWSYFRFYDPNIFSLISEHLNEMESNIFYKNIDEIYFLKNSHFYSLKNNASDCNLDPKNKLIITPYLQKIFHDYQQSIFIKKIINNLPKYKDHKQVLDIKEKKEIINELNRAYLFGLTNPKAIYYFLIAQIVFFNKEFLSLWSVASHYSSSQEIRALHYLDLTINKMSRDKI
ncbi:DUF4123 domain-containing protein [Proteus cibi]|uniref:DUF4123 domain-containing protein n=1 Tax=Proteus cibi TaxID=2050966 RepID=A0ABU6EE51_9GAMM|nr:DUF4123 domain-containing protein [Proteus cibi]MEB6857346.1 DUF4123 domain-containing protein [Proteus cibi]MEB7088865.1 DUF4123 domain-containing protein [Proteus cibi]